MEFDPDDRETYPQWSSLAVLQILREESFKRLEHKFSRGKQTNWLYSIQTIEFSCSCVCGDDSGWQSCGQGLHATLSASNRNSSIVADLRNARRVFDGILAEAWRRSDMAATEYVEYHEARAASFILSPKRWMEGHDLLGKSVWQAGYLYADVCSLPGEQRIAIFERENEIVLHQINDASRETAMRLDLQSAIKMIFGP